MKVPRDGFIFGTLGALIIATAVLGFTLGNVIVLKDELTDAHSKISALESHLNIRINIEKQEPKGNVQVIKISHEKVEKDYPTWREIIPEKTLAKYWKSLEKRIEGLKVKVVKRKK